MAAHGNFDREQLGNLPAGGSAGGGCRWGWQTVKGVGR